ncbi:S8 family serine peptidase [Primorskyibacter sp. S187A]|uniref:S8 family serine peptidase n=1 Tax=Primorskyibacter sp. S187A TaxID=3415130 RepID=UPI003C7E2C90
MSATSNPLFSQQWHFPLIGEIETVWQAYTGATIQIGVYDDGTEQFHRDLSANYDASLHYRGLGSDDGQPSNSSASHGTAVAGIIAAANNTTGGVGVAYDATITGVDLLNDVFAQGGSVVLDSLRYMANFDITNNSWGYIPTYAAFLNLTNRFSQSSREAEAFAVATSTGRDGLGTVIVKAAGNDANSSFLENTYGRYGNAQGEGLNSLHTIVTVAATGRSGDVASYSNWGANVLIAAPAASVTTDREGSRGYSFNDVTTGFGGTSAATPVTSGVVALMLEANDDLGWRDVQNILALSASHTGSDYGSNGQIYEQGRWFSNGAEHWNGGGMSFHLSYGFGMVDARAAVRMAEAWDLLHDSPATTANERTQSVVQNGTQQWDNGTRSFTLNVQNDMALEHLYIRLIGSHTAIGELSVKLEAPTGEIYDLFLREGRFTDLPGSWTFGVAGVLDMAARGTWQVHISDHVTGNSTRISQVQMDMHGSEARADTHHHITEDFRLYAARDTDRRLLRETDGGQDWLNLASLQGDVDLALRDGGALSVDGTPWATIEGRIEQVIAGDGDDTLRADGADNALHGARGDDSLRGGGGDDTLEGGAGADRLHGDAGHDRVSGDAGADLLVGRDGNDTLDGGSAADRLYGNDGRDALFGGSGADTLSGGNDADRLEGGTGADSLRGGNGDDTLEGGDGADALRGQNGDDRLTGGGGEDTINGEDGDDWGQGSDGDDIVLGRAGNDTLRGGAADDLIYAGQDDDLVAGNDGDDTLEGGSNNDRLFGGNGDDLLVGGPGADTMSGGAGADVFVFDLTRDMMADVISDFISGEDLLAISGPVPELALVAEFSGRAGELRYDAQTGQLFVDSDGDGTGTRILTLTNAPDLSTGDFFL